MSQRPIELKEFWSLSFRAPLLVEGSMLEGYRCVTALWGAEMEAGENGAIRLWNGYTREKSINFLQKNL